MKTKLLAIAVALAAVQVAQATLYTYTWSSGFANAGVVPDGNVGGWSDTREISNITGDDTILGVNVRLNISGGYNGDLYGYLVHSTGFTVLLNRIGRDDGDPFGNSGSGMNITLSDDAATDVHAASYVTLTGSYQPDGRSADPASVVTGDTRDTSLASFISLGGNGSWTLFLADMASGDTSTLVSWGLDIEVVPEPTTWALGLFAGLLGAAKLGQHLRRRK